MSIPGIPPLPDGLGALFDSATSLVSDVLNLSSLNQPVWGIYLNGAPVIAADSVITFSYRQEFDISKNPVEGGSFSSYNKVQRPGDIRLRLAKGGSVSDREGFLESIAAISGDTNLYDVVTPEVIYSNFNCIRQGYERASYRGQGLIQIDIGLEEVRTANISLTSTTTSADGTTSTTQSGGGSSGSTAAPGNSATPQSVIDQDFATINGPQDPGASPTVNGGNVQTLTPTAGQSSSFYGNFNSQMAVGGGF